MEELDNRHENSIKALMILDREITLLKDSRYEELYETIRNSVIQSFEFSLDTFWKFIKVYLQKKLGITIDLVSPRSVLRSALQAGVLLQPELDLLNEAIDDRNMTSHTYHEELAEAIAHRIPLYAKTMHDIIRRMSL
jgi:nucleotidyltransferase substrate binding protein (TIGR01987 family)